MSKNNKNNVGKALEIGFLRELFDESEKINLKAAIVYLFINGFISSRCALILEILIGSAGAISFDNDDKKVDHICDLAFEIMSDWKFSSRVRLNSLDALFAYTSKMEIPDWLLQQADEIYEHIPDVTYLNETLFYLSKEAGRTILMGESVSGLNYKKKLSYCVGDSIEGLDTDGGILYLTTNNMPANYFEYHIENQYLRVVNKTLLGVSDGLPLYIDDGYIKFSVNNKQHIIMKVSDEEQYDVRDGYIFVRPSDSSVDFFKPYLVFLDGKKRLCSETYIKNNLWSHITSYLGVKHYIPFCVQSINDEGKLEDLNNYVSPKMTVSVVKERLKGLLGERLYTNKEAIQFDQVLDIISRHCNSDDFDLTDLLYTLISAERHYHTNYSEIYGFTHMVYFRLLDLEETDNLDILLKDVECLKDKMIVVNEEESVYKEENSSIINCPERIWIGNFEFQHNELVYTKCHMNDAVILEDIIVFPPTKAKYKGMVSFDTKVKKYFIYYPRYLEKHEIDKLSKEFVIDTYEYNTVVQSI